MSDQKNLWIDWCLLTMLAVFSVSLLSDLGAMRKAFEAIYNSDKRQ